MRAGRHNLFALRHGSEPIQYEHSVVPIVAVQHYLTIATL